MEGVSHSGGDEVERHLAELLASRRSDRVAICAMLTRKGENKRPSAESMAIRRTAALLVSMPRSPLEVHPVGAGAVEQGVVTRLENRLPAVLVPDGLATQLHREQAEGFFRVDGEMTVETEQRRL